MTGGMNNSLEKKVFGSCWKKLQIWGYINSTIRLSNAILLTASHRVQKVRRPSHLGQPGFWGKQSPRGYWAHRQRALQGDQCQGLCHRAVARHTQRPQSGGRIFVEFLRRSNQAVGKLYAECRCDEYGLSP